MNGINEGILQSTMAGLEAGLKVLHITTFQPQCCGPDANMCDVVANPDWQNFDYIPVRENGRYLGVVKREQGITGPAKQHMRPLDDDMLVSAEQPLAQYIAVMPESPYRLVVQGTKIQGLVTWSDALKLPVRLLTFTLVTHLEMVMADVIRAYCPDDQAWLSILNPNRRTRVEGKAQRLKNDRLDPSWLEFTDFCDKRDIVAAKCPIGARFVDDLKRIEELRNKLAHAAAYADNEGELRAFVETLTLMQQWIDELHALLTSDREGQA